MANEVALVDSFRIMKLSEAKLSEIFEANLGDDSLRQGDLERIVMPSGTTPAFTVPSREGNDIQKEFTGIIVAHKKARSYWKNKYSGQGESPECHSPDGKRGIGNPGGNCESCPLSQWIDDEPPACTDQRILFILLPDKFLPYMIVVPPTSIPSVKQYMIRLFNDGVEHFGVTTKFTLEKAQSASGKDFFKMKLSSVEDLAPDKVAKLKIYNDNIKGLIGEVAGAPLDKEDSEEEPGYNPDTGEVRDEEPLTQEELNLADEALDKALEADSIPDIDNDPPPKKKAPAKKKTEDKVAEEDAEEARHTMLDEFLNNEEPSYGLFYAVARSLGKEREVILKHFKVDTLKEVEKERLDDYLVKLWDARDVPF